MDVPFSLMEVPVSVKSEWLRNLAVKRERQEKALAQTMAEIAMVEALPETALTPPSKAM